MIAHGVLEQPTVDGAMMIHVMAGMPFPAGTVIVSSPGVSAPAADTFTIQVQGKGCHGSMPHTGIDPLTAAAHILLALQEISARELSMSDPAALTIGTIHGGTAANAIPDTATMTGTIRSFDESTRSFLKQRLTEISAATAAVFRAAAEVIFQSGCPTLINDPSLAACAEQYGIELLGAERTLSVASLKQAGGDSAKSAGSEDFAHISQLVPSIMIALASGHPEEGYCYPQHHPKVAFDEKALPIGAAVYAYFAMRWLEDHPQ